MIGLEFIVGLKGMEFKQIANYLDISSQAVSDWVRGKRKIPDKRAAQLSAYFRIDKGLIVKELDEQDKQEIYYKLNNSVDDIDEIKSDEMIESIEFEQIMLDLEGKVEGVTIKELEEKVRSLRNEVKTDELDITISELVNMYDQRRVIDIHPEFQRLFRWSPIQKTKFIESILLGIPIPPMFVSEDENSAWDVIDGVQRLSTIFEFLGVLRDEYGNNVKPSILMKTTKMPELEGKVWSNAFYEHKFAIDNNMFLANKFLGARLKVIRIGNESDTDVKYDIFDRLNTGGSRLSEQEIRNCLAIMLNRKFYVWLRMLSTNKDFERCTPLSEEAKKKQIDLEYVLRFIVYRHIEREEYSLSDEISEIITNKMKSFCETDTLDYDKEKEIFDKTFELLNQALSGDAFKKYYEDSRFKGQVLISSFEIIAIGVSKNLQGILKRDNPVMYIQDKVKQLYSNEEYCEMQKNRIASLHGTQRFTILTQFGIKYFSR